MTDGPDCRDRLVAEDASLRPPAPPDVWDHMTYGSWRDVVWALMADMLGEPVRQAFMRRPPEFVVGDDLSWLDKVVLAATGQRADIKALTARRLKHHYRAIRAFHATRTNDVGSFYRQGLLALDLDAVHARAAALFLGGAYPELTRADLDAAIASVDASSRQGRLYFESNERHLTRLCGQYALYGGEYLSAVARALTAPGDYRGALRDSGQATVFLCDVPLAMLRESTLLEFAGRALADLFDDLKYGGCEPMLYRGAGFCIHRTLPGDYLVGHYHPGRVRDPYLGREVDA